MASRFDGQLRWLHKVRLYPSCAQERALIEMLRVTRELYNALLQQRRDAWITRRSSLTARRQYAQLTELRAAERRFAAVYRECEVPGVGAIRLRKGRLVPEFGRAFIVTKNGRWYAVFEAHRAPSPLPMRGQSVGIDRGVRVLAALSDGTFIENRRAGSRWRTVLERHARALDAARAKTPRGACSIGAIRRVWPRFGGSGAPRSARRTPGAIGCTRSVARSSGASIELRWRLYASAR